MDQFTLLVGRAWPIIVFASMVCAFIAYRVGYLHGRLGK